MIQHSLISQILVGLSVTLVFSGCSKQSLSEGLVAQNQASTVEASSSIASISDCVSVKNFGAKGDAVTDDTLALQQAINQGGKICIPKGIYKTTQTITLQKNETQLIANDATLLVAHAGIGLDFIGLESLNRIVNVDLSGHLSVVSVPGNHAQPGSIGLRLRNTYQSQLRGFSIEGFNIGLLLLGEGSGTVYNLIEPRVMKNNYQQIVFRALVKNGILGWANQNTIIGGRWVLFESPSDRGQWNGGAHIIIEGNNYLNNGNLFLHVSLEGPSRGVSGANDPHPLAVKCDGMNNRFIDTRTEGTTDFIFGTQSSFNTVNGGTYVYQYHVLDLSRKNHIETFTNNAKGTVFSGDIHLGQASSLENPSDTSLSIGSSDLGTKVGLFLPVQDGKQNSRAWITLDASEKVVSYGHTYSSGGDLDYVFGPVVHGNRIERLKIAKNDNVHVGQGDLVMDSATKGVVLKAPGGNPCFRLVVNNEGALSTQKLDRCD